MGGYAADRATGSTCFSHIALLLRPPVCRCVVLSYVAVWFDGMYGWERRKKDSTNELGEGEIKDESETLFFYTESERVGEGEGGRSRGEERVH